MLDDSSKSPKGIGLSMTPATDTTIEAATTGGITMLVTMVAGTEAVAVMVTKHNGSDNGDDGD